MSKSFLLLCAATLIAGAIGLWSGQGARAADEATPASQQDRGEDVYFASCSMCHNDDLSGGAMHAAPPLAGDAFKARWNGRTAADLLTLTRSTMPEGQPQSLGEQAYLDVVAFILKSNKVTQTGVLTTQSAAQLSFK